MKNNINNFNLLFLILLILTSFIIINDVNTKRRTIQVSDTRFDSKLIQKFDQNTVLITTENERGTGFLVRDGIVATNYHVVKDRENISLHTVNGDKYSIRLDRKANEKDV